MTKPKTSIAMWNRSIEQFIHYLNVKSCFYIILNAHFLIQIGKYFFGNFNLFLAHSKIAIFHIGTSIDLFHIGIDVLGLVMSSMILPGVYCKQVEQPLQLAGVRCGVGVCGAKLLRAPLKSLNFSPFFSNQCQKTPNSILGAKILFGRFLLWFEPPNQWKRREIEGF